MANHIPVYYIVVIQKARGGISPRRQLMLGPRRAEELRHWRELSDNRCYARVMGERAEAVARGVQVVVDETLPDNYIESDYWV